MRDDHPDAPACERFELMSVGGQGRIGECALDTGAAAPEWRIVGVDQLQLGVVDRW